MYNLNPWFINDDRSNQAERVGSFHLDRVPVGSPCKCYSFPIRDRRGHRNHNHPRHRRFPPNDCAPDKGSGVVPGKIQACSTSPAEERVSAEVSALPSAPPRVLADESRPGMAWTPPPARVPGLSLASCTESRSDGSPAQGRVYDGAPTKEKGILDQENVRNRPTEKRDYLVSWSVEKWDRSACGLKEKVDMVRLYWTAHKRWTLRIFKKW